jgi:hypothetical protein
VPMHTPRKLVNFFLTPQKKELRSKDADGHNPSETAFLNPPHKFLSIRGGGEH